MKKFVVGLFALLSFASVTAPVAFAATTTVTSSIVTPLTDPPPVPY